MLFLSLNPPDSEGGLIGFVLRTIDQLGEIGVGALIIALGIYLAAGGAAAVIFVGLVLVVVGMLSSWRLSQVRRSSKAAKNEE